MAINRKIIALIGIMVALVLVFIGINQYQGKSSQTSVVEQEQLINVSQDLPIATLNPATGDIDETVDTILADVLEDEDFFADAIKDGELIEADNQSINNFGQSYYENEF